MGIIKRQGIKGTLVSYLGILLGYLNMMVIFPVCLEKEQMGLIAVMISAASLFAVFSQLGMSNTAIRFFPYFRDDTAHHKGLMVWLLLIPALGFLVFLMIWMIFREEILAPYQENAPLLVHYANWLIPVTLFMMLSMLLESWASIFQRITTPRIIRELGLKILATLSVLLYWQNLISFDVFILFFSASYLVAFILLVLYIIQLGRWHFVPDWSFINRKMGKEMAIYSLFIILGGVGSSIITRIDQIMISEMVGLDAVAVYTIAMSIAVVIEIPMRAMLQISTPIVAEAVAADNKEMLLNLYRKSTITQLIAGFFLFGGIWINTENIFGIMPKGNEFLEGKYVILWIGLSKLFDMATSINGTIINNSKYYRVSLYLMGFLALIAIGSNRIFIPMYGVEGAALATTISIFIYNVLMLGFVWIKFGIQPFQKNTLYLIMIMLFALGINTMLPALPANLLPTVTALPQKLANLTPVLGDILFRSIIFTLVFCGLTWILKISPDINLTIRDLIIRGFGWLKPTDHR